MRLALQGAAGAPGGPWTTGQVHDTIAKIAAQPMYASNARQSLLGRFLRYLWSRLDAFISLFEGSVNARIVVIVAALLVALMIAARVVVERRLEEERRRRGL